MPIISFKELVEGKELDYYIPLTQSHGNEIFENKLMHKNQIVVPGKHKIRIRISTSDYKYPEDTLRFNIKESEDITLLQLVGCIIRLYHDNYGIFGQYKPMCELQYLYLKSINYDEAKQTCILVVIQIKDGLDNEESIPEVN